MRDHDCDQARLIADPFVRLIHALVTHEGCHRRAESSRIMRLSSRNGAVLSPFLEGAVKCQRPFRRSEGPRTAPGRHISERLLYIPSAPPALDLHVRVLPIARSLACSASSSASERLQGGCRLDPTSAPLWSCPHMIAPKLVDARMPVPRPPPSRTDSAKKQMPVVLRVSKAGSNLPASRARRA